MQLLVIFLSDKPKSPGFRKVGFSFEKDDFQWPNVSRSKADFDPRPPPMENMNLLLALYTHFRGGDGPTHGPQIALEVNQLCPKISQICKEWKKFLSHVGYNLVTFFRRF